MKLYPGTAGAAAAAEGERRKNKRIDEVRRRHGTWLPQSPRKWLAVTLLLAGKGQLG